MLILTRRIGERIKIGDNIDITVLGIRGHQVKLGVSAPRDVSVHREEIYEKIRMDELLGRQPGNEVIDDTDEVIDDADGEEEDRFNSINYGNRHY